MADSSTLINIYNSYRKEADEARRNRLEQNKINFNCYHLRQNYDDKQRGQSQEFLPRMAMAVEQSANFMQQGLVDIGDWYRIYPADGLNEDLMKVKPSEMQRILSRQLVKTKFMTQIGDAAKLGLIGSLMIAKVHGCYKPRPKYKVESKMVNGSYKKKLVKIEDKAWELKIDLVRQEDFYPDPTGRGQYYMQDIYMDYHDVEALAKGKDAIYDMAIVKQLKASGPQATPLKEYEKARETGQNITNSGFRKQIKLTEIWGNFIDENGDLLYENCVATIANDTWVIQEPSENPFWHGQNPYIITPVLTVPGSVWGKALMDAPTMLNIAINEMFNLILDGGMMSVHGIKQLREHWLEDASQVEDGIAAGDTLRVNTACPPGATALERVDTATVPQDGINVFNLLSQEFVTSALTNDFRMGVQPFRAVKATEIVESSQSLTSMFSGIAKHVELDFITPILTKAWCVCAQHLDDFDSTEVTALIGAERAKTIQALGPEELFAETVQGGRYEVFGITATLNKQKDFTKLQSLLQTISSSPTLMEEFTKTYDFGKLLGEIITSLDINKFKIEHDDPLPGSPNAPEANGAPQAQQGQGAQENAQSQIPQAGSANNAGIDSTAASVQPNAGTGAISAPVFPPSRATPRAG